jgi:hypothetical protein
MLSYAEEECTINERFFGRIEEIWELNYCGEKMPMFRVRWAKNIEKRPVHHHHGHTQSQI